MTAFQIEAVAELDINGNARNLGAVTALRDGGFAIVQVSPAVDEVVVFGCTNDGGAQRIGGDIPLALEPGAGLLSRADGGFVVVERVLDATEPTGNLNILHAFDALGGSLETYSFTGSVAIVGFDTTLDPEAPKLWAPRTISGVRTLVLLDSDAMIPTDPPTEVLLPPFNGLPQLFFDGGFRFEIGQTRGEIRQAEAVRPDIGPDLPTFFDPANASFTQKIAAGNRIVEVVAGLRAPVSGLGFDTFVTLRHYNPDGSAPLTTLDEFLGKNLQSGPSVLLTEAPGIGYALLVAMIDSFNVVTQAEVRLYSFAGDELGRQSMDGIVGQRIANFQFKALVDPDHQTVRLLTAWTPFVRETGIALPTIAEIAVIDPGASQFALGTDFADFLAGLDTADDLFGGTGGDVLDGFGGDDALFGGLGDNRIRGGGGNDRIDAEDGADFLNGGGGNDRITCGEGQDSVFGGTGRDLVSGAKGKDLIFGEGGADILSGGLGDDAIFGDVGSDSLQGDEGQDVVEGGDGNDLVSGGEGDDLVEGDAQDDTLFGGAGRDTLTGGDGNDQLHATSADLGDIETLANLLEGGRGADVLFGNQGDDTLNGDAGNDQIFGDGGAGAGNDQISGGDGDDDLIGESGDDDLSGGRGADTLVGGLGSDLLSGGLGKDRLLGGGGVDSFIFASADEAGFGRSRDVIRDFSVDDDVIDLAGVFAAAPVYIQGNAFSGTQAELRYLTGSGLIEGDVNGDGTADFQIELKDAPALSGVEFVL